MNGYADENFMVGDGSVGVKLRGGVLDAAPFRRHNKVFGYWPNANTEIAMAFQFTCPQGHLLQAEESQARQQCQCPECGVPMLIPPPTGAEPSEGLSQEETAAGSELAPSAKAAFPALHTAPDFSRLGEATPTQAEAPPELTPAGPKVLHIPCPSGHVLETPEEMIGQDALCPFCNAPFRVRYDDSLERRRERELEEERRQARAARAWLNWSIAIAAAVVAGVILLFVIRASG